MKDVVLDDHFYATVKAKLPGPPQYRSSAEHILCMLVQQCTTATQLESF
jgi:hypothetical protein